MSQFSKREDNYENFNFKTTTNQMIIRKDKKKNFFLNQPVSVGDKIEFFINMY